MMMTLVSLSLLGDGKLPPTHPSMLQKRFHWLGDHLPCTPGKALQSPVYTHSNFTSTVLLGTRDFIYT